MSALNTAFSHEMTLAHEAQAALDADEFGDDAKQRSFQFFALLSQWTASFREAGGS